MGRPYDSAVWRTLLREGCALHVLTGDACSGDVGLHHVHPISLGGDVDGETVPVCAKHHPSLEALARRVYGEPRRRRCGHRHVTREGREACERRLNRDAVAA